MERIPITDAIRAELQTQQRRTGLGPNALIRSRSDKPSGLYGNLVIGWMKGRLKSAKKEHLEYVRQLWAAEPDAAERFVYIDPKTLAELRRHKKRVGIGFQRLLRDAQDKPAGVTIGAINNWIAGKVKRVAREDYDYVLKLLKDAPNTDERFIILDDKARNRLNAEQKRTGVSPASLLRYRNDIPARLSPATITAWIGGRIGKIERDKYVYVLELWQSLPDKPP